MKNAQAKNDSKYNDIILMEYMKWKWPGRRSPILWYATADGSLADLCGTDFISMDTFAIDNRKKYERRYDSKYLNTPYAWFCITKKKADGTQLDVDTDNYVYVWSDIAVMFERQDALRLVAEKGYATRTGKPDPDSGCVSTLVTIPKLDLMALPTFTVLEGFYPFLEERGLVLRGERCAWAV